MIVEHANVLLQARAVLRTPQNGVDLAVRASAGFRPDELHLFVETTRLTSFMSQRGTALVEAEAALLSAARTGFPNLQTIFSAPVLVNGAPVGSLSAVRRSRGAPVRRWRQSVEALAELASIALSDENSTLSCSC